MNLTYCGLDDSVVLRKFYGMTARELLAYYQKNHEHEDIRVWMKREADYIKANDK